MPSSSRPQDDDAGVFAKIPEGIRWDLEHGRAREVLVELIDRDLQDAGIRDAAAPTDDAASAAAPLSRSVHDEQGESVSEKAERYRQLQERVLSQSASDAVSVRFQYVNIPLLHVKVRDLAGLLSLTRNPEVLAVHEDGRMEHQLAESLPLIQQPAAASAGYLGAGTSVAVLDTGCDFTRTAFGSCASAGATNCKVAVARDFGVSDNVRDTNNHGTNVSAIVLGVAPSTKILALDVFETTQASYSTIIQAIDWVITNRATYNIAAINMSLGGGLSTTVCSSDPFATPVANARAAGVLSAIASGNNASSTSISSPACVPAAISVGAVWDANAGGYNFSNCSNPTTAADRIACFSNSASFLSMLAPGALISAGGEIMTGTSQATPHVAGAIAVARAAFPGEPVSATVTRLTSTGPSITDTRNGVTVHRLDLNAALGGAGVVDVTAPTGSMTINTGAAATRTASVMLALSASDDSNLPVSMCISNTTTCTTYSAVSATKTWALTTGEGAKTVYVTFRDPSGNKTTLSQTIQLDTTAPTGAALNVTPGNAQVELSWPAASDAGSGVATYKLQVMANSTTPPSCTTGSTIYTGANTSFTHTGLSNGLMYAYRLCPIDVATNIGTGVTALARPAPEFDGPTGTVVINQDAAFTSSTSVMLSLSAADASGIASMCISNTTTCTVFSAFAASKPWTITTTNGAQLVRVWFKDIYGNVSASPAGDTIILDTVVPTANTVSAVADNAKVTLTWTAATDASSGIAGYKVVSALNNEPNCTSGTMVYNGTELTTTVTGLTNGNVYVFRVCPRDTAGNLASGGTTAARPAPEFDGPTGTIAINQDAAFTNSTTVTLSLSAADASGVASMCISNGLTCTVFGAFAATKTWAIATTNGTQTVRVWFKDIYGNVSAAPATDAIILDTVVPTTNTVSAAADDAKVTLTWSAATDASSGIAGYKVMSALNTAPSCSSGTMVYDGTERTTTVTGLVNGSVYAFRVCPRDVAGNITAGGTTTARPAPEFDGPTGTVSINQDAAFTNNTTVSLGLSAADASGVAALCISNTTTCTTFTAFAATKTWTLTTTNGSQTVRVWFKDIYGNISAVPASDTIVLDTGLPSGNTVSAVAGDTQVTLSWSAATDTSSGIAGYKVMRALGGTAPSCTTGTQVYDGTDRTTTVTGLVNGTLYTFRVCPRDLAGNVTTGGAVATRPAPELDGPTGTVVINQGAAFTNNKTVTLTLSAADASGVGYVCMSNSTTCTAYVAYATSKTWALSIDSGTATVRVWFMDIYGNVSATAASDTITFDSIAPSASTLSAMVTSGSAALRWTAASDASGIAGYRVRMQLNTAPTCVTGTEIYNGTALSFTHTGLTNGLVYAYRVCPVDAAGNVALGGSLIARPQ